MTDQSVVKVRSHGKLPLRRPHRRRRSVRVAASVEPGALGAAGDRGRGQLCRDDAGRAIAARQLYV